MDDGIYQAGFKANKPLMKAEGESLEEDILDDILPVNKVLRLDQDVLLANIPYYNLEDLKDLPKGKKFQKKVYGIKFISIVLNIVLCAAMLSFGVKLFYDIYKGSTKISISAIFQKYKIWLIGLGVTFIVYFVVQALLSIRRRGLVIGAENLFTDELFSRKEGIRKIVNRWNLEHFLPRGRIFVFTSFSGQTLALLRLTENDTREAGLKLREGDEDPLGWTHAEEGNLGVGEGEVISLQQTDAYSRA